MAKHLLPNRHIPFHYQSPQAIDGIYVHNLAEPITEVNSAHQEDHYLLLILQKGSCKVQVEMQPVLVESPSMLLVKPFQIHFLEEMKAAEGWLISAEAFLLPDTCTAVYHNLTLQQQYQLLSACQQEAIVPITSLLFAAFRQKHAFSTQVAKGLLDALLHTTLPAYAAATAATSEQPPGRAQVITSQFRKLLSGNSCRRTPAFFADKLHITVSHLNDCVKATTGYSVTHWLHYTLITQARRLLYYTNLPVKEVAYELGFQDHTYFSRLFRQITNETPATFRKRFRESSN